MIGASVVLFAGCRHEDRSPKPTGTWTEIAEGASPDGVWFSLWETGSNRPDSTCLSLELSVQPDAPLPTYPSSAIPKYRGREPVCIHTSEGSDEVQFMYIDGGDRYGFVYLITRDGSQVVAVETSSGEQVQNAVSRDRSDEVDAFVGFYRKGGVPASLTIRTGSQERECTVERTDIVPTFDC